MFFKDLLSKFFAKLFSINIIKLFIEALILIILISATFNSKVKDKKTLKAVSGTPYKIKIPVGFPTMLNIPADNPMTVEGHRIRQIFILMHGRLSGRKDSLMACATCHKQQYAHTSGLTHSPNNNMGHPYGLTGIPTTI